MKKTVSLLLAACLGASMLLSGCQSTKEPTKTETAAEKAAEETTAAAKEESKAEALPKLGLRKLPRLQRAFLSVSAL